MPYKVWFNEQDGIVQATFSGSAVKEDHYAAFEAASRLCEQHACSKLLVDFGEVSGTTLSLLDYFTLAEAVTRSPLKLCIAHILPQHDETREKVTFGSNVEANRGQVTGEFETREQARKWLLGMKSSS